MSKERPCPCGTNLSYAACCQPSIELGQQPPTAEALMRSRYTAFTLKNAVYLLSSWHSSTSPKELDLEISPTWCNLEILATKEGSENDTQGIVEFKATYMGQGKSGTLHEVSRFIHEEGRWFYVAGDVQETDNGPHPHKVGRNDPCPCGSGKKFKKCCGP